MRWAALILMMAPLAALAETRYYFNERFDVSLQVPTSFEALPPPENGDGRSFQDGAGAELSVFGRSPVFASFKEDFSRHRAYRLNAGASVTYEAFGWDWYVMSGYADDGRIYYLRTLQGATCEGEPVIGSYILTYPEDQAETYEPMITGLNDSLHIGACG